MVDDYATRVIEIRKFQSGECNIRWDTTEIETRKADGESDGSKKKAENKAFTAKCGGAAARESYLFRWQDSQSGFGCD